MPGLLPYTAKLHVTTVKNNYDMVKFTYEETFVLPPEDHYMHEDVKKTGLTKVIANTIGAIRKVLPSNIKVIRITNRDRAQVEYGLRISGVVTRTRFGNMMTTEFMNWGTIGEMKFRDLFLGVMVGAASAASKK